MKEPRIAIKGNTPIPTVKVSEPRIAIKGNTPIPKVPKISSAMDILLDALSV